MLLAAEMSLYVSDVTQSVCDVIDDAIDDAEISVGKLKKFSGAVARYRELSCKKI